MQPELPPKPLSNSIITKKPAISTPSTSSSFHNLPATYILDRFYELSNTTPSTFPYPKYLQSLPNDLRNEFVKSDQLLLGYLNTEFPDIMCVINNEVKEFMKSQCKLAQELKTKLDELENNMKPTIERIKEYNEKLHHFQNLQLQLFESLDSISSKSLAQKYSQLVKENQLKCFSLINSIDNKILAAEELDDFLEKYTQESYQKYMNKEWSEMCYENSIQELK